MSANYSYQGKYALITGASSGIGYELAKSLHRRGANLWLVARRKDRLEALAQQFNHERSGSCTITVCDLTIPEDLQDLAQQIRTSTIDILVSNAGRGSLGEFALLPAAGEEQIVALNVAASTTVLSAAAHVMHIKKSGAILVVSSIVAFQPMPAMATYAASKVFNLFQALALREELGKYGIHVTALCPGPTATEFFGAAQASDLVKRFPRDDAEFVAERSADALAHNRAIVVPTWRAEAIATFARVLPLRLSAWFGGKMFNWILAK